MTGTRTRWQQIKHISSCEDADSRAHSLRITRWLSALLTCLFFSALGGSDPDPEPYFWFRWARMAAWTDGSLAWRAKVNETALWRRGCEVSCITVVKKKKFSHLKPWWVCTVSVWTGPSAGFWHFVLQPVCGKKKSIHSQLLSSICTFLIWIIMGPIVTDQHLQWAQTYHEGFFWFYNIPASVPLIDVAEWRKGK